MASPNEILQAANLLNQVTSALAADLAITVNPTLTVKIEVAAANNSRPTLFLAGSEVESFIAELVEDRLNKLQQLGVDTEQVLQPYKEAAEKLAESKRQQFSTPLDKRTEP